MEFGLDISTLAVAVIAAGWTYWTWRQSRTASAAAEKAREDRDAANKKLEEQRHTRKQERQTRQDELDERKYRHRDIAEAHEIHKELTSRTAYMALQRADTEPDRSYLIGLHQRLEKRLDMLLQTDEASTTEGDGVDAFTPMIYERLEAIRTATGSASVADRATEVPTRDFTKYSWDGKPTKFGKGGILNLVGARFAKLNEITTVNGFTTRFGDIVEDVLRAEIQRYAFDRESLLSALLYEGQRERYAIANRRWRDAYGADGVMTLDGEEYLVSWGLGFTGAKLAPLQKKLIAHFAADSEHYTIVEFDRG